MHEIHNLQTSNEHMCIWSTDNIVEKPGTYATYMFGTNSICYQRPKAGYET